MNNRSVFRTWVPGIVVILIGLLNVALGTLAVVSGVFFPNLGENASSAIGIGSIIFGLIMLCTGGLWITSAIGLFTIKEWAPRLAVYIAPVIVGINVAGVLNLWGFTVNIGWAAISAVAAVGSIWYLSKKELASFFIISVAEHVLVLIIFAVLIYGEPPVESSEQAISVILLPEKEEEQTKREVVQKPPPKIQEVVQKKPEPMKTETLPELPDRIRDLTDTDHRVDIVAPQTLETRVTPNVGDDTVLPPPGVKRTTLPDQDIVMEPGVKIDLQDSKISPVKPGTPDRSKDTPRPGVDRIVKDAETKATPGDSLTQVYRPSFVGRITGEVEGRKVEFWPEEPKGFSGTSAGSVTIEFKVNPDGHVDSANITIKSGNFDLDKKAKEYVLEIRFEKLPEGSTRKVQSGEISIVFKLTGESQ